MPKTRVSFYRDEAGRVPVREWLRELRRQDVKAHAKCVARIEHLADRGNELRRPVADYLTEGVHELRARSGRVNYRILYFFHGRNVAILAHALTKEGRISDHDLDLAMARRALVIADPGTHIHEEDEP